MMDGKYMTRTGLWILCYWRGASESIKPVTLWISQNLTKTEMTITRSRMVGTSFISRY